MKKVAYIMLAACLSMSLCACGANDVNDRNDGHDDGVDNGVVEDNNAVDGVIDDEIGDGALTDNDGGMGNNSGNTGGTGNNGSGSGSGNTGSAGNKNLAMTETGAEVTVWKQANVTKNRSYAGTIEVQLATGERVVIFDGNITT